MAERKCCITCEGAVYSDGTHGLVLNLSGLASEEEVQMVADWLSSLISAGVESDEWPLGHKAVAKDHRPN